MEIECYTICYWFIADDMIQIKAGHPYKLISCFTWSLLICLNIVLVNFWVDAIEICYFVLWHLYLVLLQRSMTETASFVLCRQWMLFCFVFLSYKVLYGTMLCICIISHFTKAVELLLSKCKCFDMSTEIWKMGCVSWIIFLCDIVEEIFTIVETTDVLALKMRLFLASVELCLLVLLLEVTVLLTVIMLDNLN